LSRENIVDQSKAYKYQINLTAQFPFLVFTISLI